MMVLLFVSLFLRREGIIDDALALVLIPSCAIFFAAFTLAVGLLSTTHNTKYRKLTVLGFGTIFLAIVGTLTSYSVVSGGGTESSIYFGVNIGLALTGVVVVMVAVRRGQSDPPQPESLAESRGS